MPSISSFPVPALRFIPNPLPRHPSFPFFPPIGKTATIRAILTALIPLHPPGTIAVTATTGVAAAALGGVTLASFAGIGVTSPSSPAAVNALVRRLSPAAARRWAVTRVLLIDEVSMLAADDLDALAVVATAVRAAPHVEDGRGGRDRRRSPRLTVAPTSADDSDGDDGGGGGGGGSDGGAVGSADSDRDAGAYGVAASPFGGIQVIAVGDFLQLPPPQGRMAFTAATWATTFPTTVLLRAVHRQTERALVAAFGDLRLGLVSDATYDLLCRMAPGGGAPAVSDGVASTSAPGGGGGGGGGDDRSNDAASPPPPPVWLCTHRVTAAARNAAALAALPDPVAVVYTAVDVSVTRAAAGGLGGLREVAALPLAVGARVVATRNEGGVANGVGGVVLDFVAPPASWATEANARRGRHRERWWGDRLQGRLAAAAWRGAALSGVAPVSDAAVVSASAATLAAWAADAGGVLDDLGGWGLVPSAAPSRAVTSAAAAVDATILLRNRLRWLMAFRRRRHAAAPAAAAAAAVSTAATAQDRLSRPHPPPTAAPSASLLPLVAYDNGVTRVVPPIACASTDGDGLPLAVRVQLPLAAGWAATVHAAQGRSLPYLVADLASAFGPGMVYVALSRAVTGRGVALLSFDPSRVRADAGAVAFYAALEGRAVPPTTTAEGGEEATEGPTMAVDPPVGGDATAASTVSANLTGRV